jgi:hypothetical protein
VVSRGEDNSPFADKRIEQEEHEGSRKVVVFQPRDQAHVKPEAPDSGTYPDQRVDELSGTSLDTGAELTMADSPSREEMAARLEAAEARTEARFAQLTGTIDVRFANLDNKIDRLVDSVGRLSSEVHRVQADNRVTRWTIITVVVASVLAGLAAIWITQGNMLAAFQASLTVRTIQSEPPKH